MSEYMKHQRALIDIQLEVVDLVAAKTFTFDTSGDGMMNFSAEDHIGHLVQQVIHDAFRDREAETGVRIHSAVPVRRRLTADGYYEAVDLPPIAGIANDGSAVMPPVSDS